MKRILLAMIIMGSLLTACTIVWHDHDSDRDEHRDRGHYYRDHGDRDYDDRDHDEQRRGY